MPSWLDSENSCISASIPLAWALNGDALATGSKFGLIGLTQSLAREFRELAEHEDELQLPDPADARKLMELLK